MLEEKLSIVKKILRKKKSKIGYVKRRDLEGLLREVMEGRIEGKRPRDQKKNENVE